MRDEQRDLGSEGTPGGAGLRVPDVEPAEPAAERSAPGPFAVLPEPVRLEDTTTSQDVAVVQDPEAGRDTENEFMLRHM